MHPVQCLNRRPVVEVAHVVVHRLGVIRILAGGADVVECLGVGEDEGSGAVLAVDVAHLALIAA